MSDRYRFDEERGELRSERDMACTAWELERQQAHEDTPLCMTAKQCERLWRILCDEAGPATAARIIKRIESEA